MELPPCIEEMKNIQNMFLDFIDNDENMQNSCILTNYKYFENLNTQEKCNKLVEIIYLISKIIDNHHRTTDFFSKIEQILSHFKKDIKQNLSNSELFNIFCHNKRILLFLFKEGILTIDESIAFWLSKDSTNYYDYFAYEIISFFNNEPINKNEENFIIFDQKRKIGENDNYICNLIRNDHVEDFIAYVNRTNLSLLTVIRPSIFETNQFLIDKEPTLIEYSVFFGSIQIFRYLQMNKVQLTSSLWIYAIHGQNPELIHLLEENNVKPNGNSYNECFIESIKCNHTDIATYIQNNYLPYQDLSEFSDDIIKYRNYNFFSNNLNSQSVFYSFVKYNYPFTVEFLLNNIEIDINYIYDIKTEKRLSKRKGDEDDKIIKNIKQSLIHVAVLNGNKEMVKILASNPKININDKMINEKTTKERINIGNEYPRRLAIHKETSNALHLAIEKGNINIVQILLSHPDIDINDISEVYESEDINVLGYYARTIKRIKTNLKKTPLHIALNNGYGNIAQILLSHKIELKNEIKERIINEIRTQKTEVIEEKTPLYIAIQNGLNEVIKFLLSECNIDVNGNIIFDENSKYMNDDDDDDEEENVSDSLNELKTTALFASIEKENVEIVRFLLSLPNIDVNIGQKGNKSPLHLAVEKENIEIVKLLLTNQKIDVNAYWVYEQELDDGYLEISEKKNSLFLAVEKENIEIVKLLLSHKNIF